MDICLTEKKNKNASTFLDSRTLEKLTVKLK